ncbi:MAG TPA: hypothetical protein VH500_07860 [Nitrososphaeraceae archaeon]|jgi:hypothetical protein
MKTNNTQVDVYDCTAHRKDRLIHEHDFVKARTKQANTFPVMAAAGYTAETFATRLCVKNINTGNYK